MEIEKAKEIVEYYLDGLSKHDIIEMFMDTYTDDEMIVFAKGL